MVEQNNKLLIKNYESCLINYIIFPEKNVITVSIIVTIIIDLDDFEIEINVMKMILIIILLRITYPPKVKKL